MALNDRVVYIGSELKARVGETGKVVAENAGPGKECGVEFERDIAGHSCDGAAKPGRGWWVLPSQVQVIDEKFAATWASKT